MDHRNLETPAVGEDVRPIRIGDPLVGEDPDRLEGRWRQRRRRQGRWCWLHSGTPGQHHDSEDDGDLAADEYRAKPHLLDRLRGGVDVVVEVEDVVGVVAA